MSEKPTYRNDRIVPLEKRAKASFGSRTDIGCLRSTNEDSLVVSAPLFAVADGMGGHDAGEIASEIAIRTLVEQAPRQSDAEALSKAVLEANRAVMQASQDGIGKPGMGTTMTAAVLDGERLVIAHVGDSRAYLLHLGKLQQITRDHSLMADMIEAGQLTAEEARTHPHRSVITRALGSDLNMLADIYEIDIEPGDRLVLCTDGLSGMITDEVIENELLLEDDPQLCANNLVEKALNAGGHDNVTAIVVETSGAQEVRAQKAARKARLFVAFTVVALAAVLFATVGGFHYYTQNSYYLAEAEGKVAIYRGLPGSLFGINMSEVESISDVDMQKLQKLKPGVANRLQEGFPVDSLEDARNIIEEYKKELNGIPLSAESSSTGEPNAAKPTGSDSA
ncbi:MAG: Stp1/IreP family PP2C-type Ser/Thr phosphatase [Eggerthellaceae bacterium]|jgi:protein phosphatase|nr:Stp1/IreP family PP2C-type Ser/Thr phosphatase [Eggerthellaceae bacterium]MDR2721348.1 Stp1/IreP family PP2C-type Ser/Thr phosphatase [Coriobacteriaceae bacterium]